MQAAAGLLHLNRNDPDSGSTDILTGDNATTRQNASGLTPDSWAVENLHVHTQKLHTFQAHCRVDINTCGVRTLLGSRAPLFAPNEVQ